MLGMICSINYQATCEPPYQIHQGGFADSYLSHAFTTTFVFTLSCVHGHLHNFFTITVYINVAGIINELHEIHSG